MVRLGADRARYGYAVIALVAYAWVIGAIVAGALPWLASVSLLPAVLSYKAARIVLREAATPARIAPAIPMTIAAATLHGLLLALSLCGARLLP